MTAAKLLDILLVRRTTAAVDGAHLQLDGPADVLADESLLTLIRRHKDELIRELMARRIDRQLSQLDRCGVGRHTCWSRADVSSPGSPREAEMLELVSWALNRSPISAADESAAPESQRDECLS